MANFLKSDRVLGILLPVWIELLQLRGCADPDPVLKNLERDALVRGAEGDDLVDMLRGLAFRIASLHRFPDDEPAHGMGDDVHLWDRLMFVLGQLPDERDEANERVAIALEVLAIIQIVVTKNPKSSTHVDRRSHKAKSCSWINDNLMAGK